MACVNNVQRGCAAALVLILLAACGNDFGSDDKSAEESGAPAATNPVGGDQSLTGGEATAGTTVPGAAGVDAPASLDPGNRKVVIRMTVGVEVADVGTAVDDVVALAERHGGQLYDSSIDLRDERAAGGDLVFKLPPEEAQPFITELGDGIGRRVSLQGTTSDVTRRLSDLDAQIANARASVERVRLLLDEATNLGEVVSLEGELTTRQTHLEELLAAKADLDGQVAMATVTVTLSAAPEAPAPATEPEENDGIGDAFGKGWDAFVAVVLGIVVVLGYAAPFIALGALAALVLWRVSRRQRQTRSRSAAPPRPPAPGEGPRTNEPDSASAARTP